MAIEDDLRERARALITDIVRLPRPQERKKLLEDIFLCIAPLIGVDIREEE